MAIIWTPEITVVNIATKTINFSATRLDESDPDNPKTYTVENRNIKTVGQKLAVMAELVTKVEEEIAQEAKDAAFAEEVAALEVQAKEYLESREV